MQAQVIPNSVKNNMQEKCQDKKTEPKIKVYVKYWLKNNKASNYIIGLVKRQKPCSRL